MDVEKTKLDGVLVIIPKVFHDDRGYFTETYNKKKLMDFGIEGDFVQDNQSLSTQKGTLRGIHFQNFPMAQTKLIRCTKGKLIDYVIDLRKNSPTYKEYISIELSEDNFKQLFIPKGFGHAFMALTDDVEIQYKVDVYYSKEHDRSIRYNDPDLNIEWPNLTPVLSEKDQNAPLLKDSDCNF